MAILRRFQPLALGLAAALSTAAIGTAALTTGAITAASAQDLVGCQLVDGLLSCVPGVSPDPQAQIKALRSQIATDIQLEGTVQQQIDGLQQMVLAGQASEGQLLQATLSADVIASLPPSAFHWYKLQAGSKQWILIQGASGSTYLIKANDVSSQVMLVVAQPTATGSQRQATPAVGPIQPASR
jgi:hypothetical protein